jgi:2,3-bisphosphoglycerate-independent phosphoglycerate mutase
MHFLFLFMDGVGLGKGGSDKNPFSRIQMPNLESLLDGKRLLASSAPLDNQRATLKGLDACLGVEGVPQSATGQSTLLTGVNVPQEIGRHYGPKPNPQVAEFLNGKQIFSQLTESGYSAALLNAYLERYFEAIQSGRRLYSAIPMAVTNAGIALKTTEDLAAGQALAADFTAQGWHDHLDIQSVPILEPGQAGRQLAELAQSYDFSLFEFWLSDYAGHRQDMSAADEILTTFDSVLGGLSGAWDWDNDLALLTSDHGNLEDLSTRRHTTNRVPALVLGPTPLRKPFANSLENLSDVAPAILKLFQ